MVVIAETDDDLIKRLNEWKENLERDCGKRLSGMWIEQGRCHGS